MQRSSLLSLWGANILPGTRVLVRVDFNVPVAEGRVVDGFRIERSLETIDFLREKGARLILVSHIAGVDSLRPVSDFLSERMSHVFIDKLDFNDMREKLAVLGDGEVALLENLRLHTGEKDNDEEFARALASLADVYVNDAFSVSHRAHASVVSVPRFLPSYAGFLLEEEVDTLSRILEPEKPLLFILGGAKFDTKIPLVERFLGIADTLLIGGALANDIYRSNGYDVGRSLVSEVDITNIASNPKVVVPADVVAERGEGVVVISAEAVQSNDLISDASPVWIEEMREKINNAKTILWNGPLGNYEAGYAEGSATLARLIAQAPGFSVIGGGDTVALVEKLGIEEGFDFISTGGGAMLDFLSSGTLPGLEVLKDKGVITEM